MLFVAPNKMAVHGTNSRVHKMEDPDNDTCADNKARLLRNPETGLTPWFVENDIFCRLLKRLSTFLNDKVATKEDVIVVHKRRKAATFPDLTTVHKDSGTKDHEEFIDHLNEAIEQIQSDESKGPDAFKHLYEGETADLDMAAGEVPLAVDTATSYGNILKRERSDSDDEDSTTAKKAHVEESVTSAAAGISHLRVSGAAENEACD